MESNTLPKIDDKALEFEIDIKDAQFNHEGYYHLQLSVQSSLTRDYSQIQLKKEGDASFVRQRVIKTDFTKQEESSPLTFFHDKKFTFHLPKGFCKNDKTHDVYLLVEAFLASDSTVGKSKKVGEGKFPIYPRPNAPRINLFAEPGENLYHYTDVLSLLRTHSSDNIQMHCGRIRCTYSLRELVPIQTKAESPPVVKKPKPIQAKKTEEKAPSPKPRTPVPLPPTQREKKPQPPPPTASSWGENIGTLNLPETPPLPPATDWRKIPEVPLRPEEKHTFNVDKGYRHVSEVGKEQIDIIIHGAANLPQTPNGRIPQPFAVVKTKKDDDLDKKTTNTTHVSLRPTNAPSFEEMLTLTLDEATAPDESIVLTMADAPNQQSLVTYKIPVSHLTPFHQYHLELNQPAKGIPGGVRTFATITRKLPRIPRDPSSPRYLGVEVLLQSVQRPIRNPLGPLIAVARIVPDYYNYKSDNLLSHPRTAGVTMNNVTFPSPHPLTFAVTQRSYHGHPQISLPGHPDQQPTWNHPYLFVEERDKATLFTPGAALVIEYYVASSAMNEQFWKMQSPVAFSMLPMDKEMYTQLIQDNAKNGLRVEGLPVQGSNIVTSQGRQPTVGMILRLITSDKPDTMKSVSNIENLPLLDMHPTSGDPPPFYRNSPDILTIEPGQPPADTMLTDMTEPEPQEELRESPQAPAYYLQKVRKKALSPIKDGEMPSIDAMENILPEYQYIFYDPKGPQEATARNLPGMSTRIPPPQSPSRGYQAEDLDTSTMTILDHQGKELDNYRSAVFKMGQDIIALRQQVRDLESNNSNLRRNLANYNDAGRLMLETSELEGLTKPEILSRYAAIKQTLSAQTADMKLYKEKVQILQNQLIKKNDDEKKYLQLQKAHNQQQAVVLKMQDKLQKMKKMEEALKKQESVIEKMEKVIEKYHKDRSKTQKDKESHEANEVLLQENKRLRDQMIEMREQLRVAGRGGDDLEKLELYQALEKAEGRINSLEKQLSENAKLWGRERADMSIKLNEAEHGFGRSTGMVLHDYPVYGERFGKTTQKRLSPMYR